MREIRKKQSRLNKIMKAIVIFTAAFILVYIGVQPFVASASAVAAVAVSYICDVLIIAALVIVFVYYSKYGKADLFLTSIERELDDAGYYLTARTERTPDEYASVMADDLSNCGYSVNKKTVLSDFEFEVRAYKRNEYFYIAKVDNLDKNDMLAYSDAAFNDITVQQLRRKGAGVICFITDKANDDAVAISKVITPYGRKNQLIVSYAIAELSTGHVYFLGNTPSKCREMTANFVMNCNVPIKEQYICAQRLPCQDALEQRMKSFTLTDFKNGTFYAH